MPTLRRACWRRLKEHIHVLTWARAGLAALHFRPRTCVTTPDGFAQTFVVKARAKSGECFSLPVMAIGFLRVGRVVCKEEYPNMVELNAITFAAAAAAASAPWLAANP